MAEINELPNGLLETVKNYLDITWDDEETDKKLVGIVKRGIKYINNIAGTDFDYTVQDKPQELLLDYVRYVRSNALDEFQINYLHELLALRISEEVAAFDKEQSSDI